MKMYVLTRRDLPVSYKAVQAGHAVAELLLRGQSHGWNNGTLVYLGVDDEDALKHWKEKLDFKEIPYSEFREPDIGDQITAIATVGNGKLFSKLKLL